MVNPIEWLLSSAEPWTRYRTLVDLLEQDENDPQVQASRTEMISHSQVKALINETASWPGYALKRHNDAKHPLYKFSTLADFGVRADDPGMLPGIEAVLAHQSPEGAFSSFVHLPKVFGGSGTDEWAWMACDAPTLLYTLLAMGLAADQRVQRALEHLVELIDANGWRCSAAPELGPKFKGPGRKDDPCPVTNLYALKALSQVPELLDSSEAHSGTEMLLWHWQNQAGRKIFLFGIGTDFRKLKYPFIWYDILHMVEVLSCFPHVHADQRFHHMLDTVKAQADEMGRFTAGSMYMAWRGWSFADKKSPSPWLTFLVLRILKRLGGVG